MKLIIDLKYKGHVIDARFLEVNRPKSGPAQLELDCDKIIDYQIGQAFDAIMKKPEPRKELDKNARTP